MTPTQFVEFLRILPNGALVRAGNRIQLEDDSGNPIGSSFPLHSSPFTAVSTLLPTLDTTPDYSSGDVVAAASNIAAGVTDRRRRLVSLTAKDGAGQAPALLVYVFDGALAGTYTGNSAVSWDATDLGALAGVIALESSNYKTAGGVSVQTLSNINLMVNITGTTFSIVIVAAGTYNVAAADDLKLTFGWENL